MEKRIKIIELFEAIYNGKNIPKKIEFNEEVYERTFEEGELAPIPLMYRNVNDTGDFLFKDYAIDMQDTLKIINKSNKEIKKVRCIETNKVFKSPAAAGRYYGFDDGDMISKVCRHVRETAKGLHFEYIER